MTDVKHRRHQLWGAPACGGLVSAFCRNELSIAHTLPTAIERKESSSPQNAETSPPQAGAPRNQLARDN